MPILKFNITPQTNIIIIPMPEEFIGKKVEIIVFPVDELVYQNLDTCQDTEHS